MSYVGLLLCVFATTCAQAVAQPQTPHPSDKSNTLPLSGNNPTMFTQLPDTPGGQLDAYEAYCSTVPGLCIVRGDGVIPSGTPCHCGEYAGQTW
jgi:hypothetical protein